MVKSTHIPAVAPTDFEMGRGAHVGVVSTADGFKPRESIAWDDFVALVTTFTVSNDKTGEYICRPMGGDGSRSDANSMPWPLLPLDLDEMLPEDLNELEKWCSTQGLDVVMATTYSHTKENPRIRLWVRCSRAFTGVEHLYLFRSFNQVAVFPFKLDPATAKPSQPIYLPRCPDARKSIAFAKYYAGAPLDVDGMLRAHQKEMHERERRNEGGRFSEGKGVRVAGGMVETFNKNFDVRNLLEAHGYKRKSRSRYVAPGSKSGRAALIVHDWGVVSFHDPAHDPLSLRNDLNQPRVLDPFAAYAVLEHHDDFIPAWKAAARIVKEKGWEGSTEGEVGSSSLAYEILSIPESIDRLRAREMVVEDLVERESLVIASGQSNSGKTTVLQLMALSVALGTTFGGHATQRGKVLWIAGEDQYNAQLRFAAMCTEYGVAPNDLHETLHILPQAVAVLDRASMSAFHEAVDRCVGYDTAFSLVIIDSKSMCWGGEDENSNDENAQFVKELSAHFVVRYGAAVIITHHLTKSKEKEEQSARGASSLINNIDHEWRFEMRPTTAITIMEPGSKLRIARWPEMRFQIRVVELSSAHYPKLRNSQGMMPKISLAEMSNAFGVSAKQSQDDAVYVDLLKALIATPITSKTRKSVNDTLARAIGKVVDGSTAADVRAARDWIRHKLRKMEEQLLIDKNFGVTRGGIVFVEQFDQSREIAGDDEVNQQGEE